MNKVEGSDNHYKLNPIMISMVGARGAGKTSLLASMYSQLQRLGTEFCTSMDDDGRTQQVMSRNISSLKAKCSSTSPIITEEGIQGTEDRTEYLFEANLQYQQAKFTVPFQFVDFPGGWYTEEGTRMQEVNEQLKASDISFIAVDAPALMSGDEFINDKFNQRDAIQALYTRHASELRGKVVIFVLLKAEKYVSEGQIDLMYEQLQDHYGPLINMLRNNQANVYISYVETLGSVMFRHFDSHNGHPVPKYRSTMQGYKPHNCETPLQLAVVHGMQRLQTKIQQEINDASWFIKVFLAIFGSKKEAAAQAIGNALQNQLNSNDLGDKLRNSKFYIC